MGEQGVVVVEHRTLESSGSGFDYTGSTILCPLAILINSQHYWLNPGSGGSDVDWDVKPHNRQIQFASTNVSENL